MSAITDSYQSSVNRALQQLEGARTNLLVEIATYPTPISGCDAQFNHLLSDRARISNAIQALLSNPFVATPRMLEPIATVENY